MSQQHVVPLFLSLVFYGRTVAAAKMRICWGFASSFDAFQCFTHTSFTPHTSHTPAWPTISGDSLTNFRHFLTYATNTKTFVQICKLLQTRSGESEGKRKRRGKKEREGNQGVLYERLQLKWPQAGSGVMLRDLTPISLSFCLSSPSLSASFSHSNFFKYLA